MNKMNVIDETTENTNEYSIIFSHVNKAYGSNIVVKDLCLEIKKGERLILLGPSGCGKTTTLRMIAGFEEISGGQLFMDGQVVNDLAPGERNIAMVFQSYALFPHLSVWENITFGLQLQKLPAAEIKSRTEQALELLHLKGYEHKKTHELSGGQKQRVALCRALVKHSPYFLLDEPLSNLDAQLRQRARTELVKLHEIFKPTMIYVTHDQIEAMTVATRIAVMNQGKIQQIDTPANIYHHPANTFVASFIGSPAMNLLTCSCKNGAIIIGDTALKLPAKLAQLVGQRDKVIFGLRPETCQPQSNKDQSQSATGTMVRGRVVFMENTGNLKTVNLELADGSTIFLQNNGQDDAMDHVQGFSFDWSKVCLFDAESGKNLEA